MTEILTVFVAALVALGHRARRRSDGILELEAAPERAGRWGEITEADYAVADDAVRRAYAAGERDPRVLGVMFHPDTDERLTSVDESDPGYGFRPGNYSVY